MAGRDRRGHALGRRAPGPRAVLDVVRDARWGRVEETIGEDPYLVGIDRHRLRARPRGRRHRRDAQALRRLLGLEGRAQPRPGLGRPARARRRAAAAVRDGDARRPARGRSCTRTPTSTACRPPPTPRCSPGCCATPGASRARSSPTTSVSRSSQLLHGVAGELGRGRRGRARRPGSTSSCRPSRRFGAPLVEAVRDGRRRRGARRPRAAPGARAEGRARPARRRLVAACRPRSPARDLDDPSRCAGRSTSTRPRTATSPARSPSSAVVLLRNDGMLPLAAADVAGSR